MSDTTQVENVPMSEVEAEVEATRIVDGVLFTELNGESIEFHPLTLRDTSEMTVLKGKLLMKLTAEGDLINESMVEPMVAQKAKQMGIPARALDPRVQQKWFRRLFEMAPRAITEGDKTELAENIESFADELTDEEFVELGNVNAVVGLRNTLTMCTVESQVNASMLRHEMVRAAQYTDGTRVWETIENLLDLPDADLTQLVTVFRIWRSGRSLDFLSGSLSAVPGKGIGSMQNKTHAKSSKERPLRGRRTKSS